MTGLCKTPNTMVKKTSKKQPLLNLILKKEEMNDRLKYIGVLLGMLNVEEAKAL